MCKNDISGYIRHRSFIQTAKYSLLDKKLFIKVSMVLRSCLVIFYFEEKFCVLACIGETCVTITAEELFERIISPVRTDLRFSTCRQVVCETFI